MIIAHLTLTLESVAALRLRFNSKRQRVMQKRNTERKCGHEQTDNSQSKGASYKVKRALLIVPLHGSSALRPMSGPSGDLIKLAG